ncbi:hypothetical protein B0H16DRAFT_1465174 [Mycena metata]|uniref:Fork-head domain-containing protein n=1 Tax=Mycena metata TaxID=1033252 RepID=A0AAD7MZY1_9AGAR|nr:hypothetical protein B0H16DRAFT_1465174 [Mycena metata]
MADLGIHKIEFPNKKAMTGTYKQTLKRARGRIWLVADIALIYGDRIPFTAILPMQAILHQFYMEHVIIDVVVHADNEGRLSPPTTAEDALARIKSCFTMSGGNICPLLDIVCAAHIISDYPTTFALDSLYFASPDGHLERGTRLCGPASWPGIVTVANITLTNDTIRIETKRTNTRRPIWLTVDASCSGVERTKIGRKPNIELLEYQFPQQKGSEIYPQEQYPGTPLNDCAGATEGQDAELPPDYDNRPDMPWAALLAILLQNKQLTVDELMNELLFQFPWFESNGSKQQWKGTVKHTLSAYKEFVHAMAENASEDRQDVTRSIDCAEDSIHKL